MLNYKKSNYKNKAWPLSPPGEGKRVRLMILEQNAQECDATDDE